MSPGLGLVIVACCVVSQGFFSGTEMALVKCDRALLRARAEQGSSGAALALDMLEKERVIPTCLIGTNLSLIGGTTVAGLVLASLGHGEEWLLTLLYLPLGLVLGETLPKQLYLHYADTLAPTLAQMLRVVQIAFKPALWVVDHWSRLLKRVLVAQEEAPMRRQDFVHMLGAQADSSIDPEDRAFIQRLLGMIDLTVEEAMTPLVDVKAVSETATVGEAIEVVLKGGFSRLPVYRDRIDNIVGQLAHRDLLFAASDADPVVPMVQSVRFVPDSKRADEMLREMRDAGEPFAAVVDEYGGSVGIVTMEDLLEQVVGDIEDERDLQGPAIRRLNDREWRVPARTPIEDLEQALGREMPPGDYETVAGLLLAVTGRIPETGAAVRVGRLTFHVEAASERAVHSVRVVVAPEP